jgi:hypothetical protein
MPTPASTQSDPLEPGLALTAWLAHDDDANDLVSRMIASLRQIPGVRSAEHQSIWEQAAWTAVALRRGRCQGSQVTLDDIMHLGVEPEAVSIAWVVGGNRRQVEESRRQVALKASRSTGIVWVAYWVARTEQARDRKKKATWATIGARAERETEVVLRELPEPAAGWLEDRLAASRHPRRG